MYSDGEENVDEYVADEHKTNGKDHDFTTSACQP